jgi:hypothetical protein
VIVGIARLQSHISIVRAWRLAGQVQLPGTYICV